MILEQPAGHEESLLESRCREQQLISAVVTVANAAAAAPPAAARISEFVGVEVISATQQWAGLPGSNWPIRCN